MTLSSTDKSERPSTESSSNVKRLKFTPPTLRTEDLKARGQAAAELLNSPVYNLAHRSAVEDLQDQWMDTLPHETQKREYLYQMVQGMGESAKKLAEYVQAAQGLNLEDLASEEAAQRAEDENRGF